MTMTSQQGSVEDFLSSLWGIAFCFAVIFSIDFLNNPIRGFVIECIAFSGLLFSHPYVVRLQALRAQRQANEKIKMQQISGGEIDAEALKIAEMPIPSYKTLLKRSAIIGVFYVPVVMTSTWFVMWIVRNEDLKAAQISLLRQFHGGSRDVMLLIMQFLLMGLMVGWIFGIILSGRRISQWVDRRFFQSAIELPEDEETRQKRKELEELAATSRWGILGVMLKVMFIIGSSSAIILFIPVGLILSWLQHTDLPSGIIILLYMLAGIGYPLFLLMFLPSLSVIFFHYRFRRQIQQEMREAGSSEKYQELQQDLDDLEVSLRTQLRSNEFHKFYRLIVWLMIGLGGFTLLALVAAAIAPASDIDRNITIGLLLLISFIMGLVLIVRGKQILRFLVKSKVEPSEIV